ncbi:MAG: GT4 family glycosyltransferase PelF [Liquorilactobacillus satsumensis]|uniref:GT4 family glycosyltransferase PelF n=1 Tax=Liquorilactobacillus satsumensis TaxID=259059 RepID=UPI0039E91FC7
MRICLVLEGSYPYVHGGVSTWMQHYLEDMPEHEFVLWVIGAHAKDRGHFVYDFPKNVVEVHEVFLDEALKQRPHGKLRHHFSFAEEEALEQLMECAHPNWELLFQLFQDKKVAPLALLQSDLFLKLLTQLCTKKYPYSAFADSFHTMRSMLLPLFYLLSQEVPVADAYHAIATGYGGLLATLGSWRYQKPLLLTEHGIYTREREEELIRAQWVAPTFKKQWIQLFYMLSDAIYQRAFRVTSLFENAKKIQAEIGCPIEKCRVIENGIDYDKMHAIPEKKAGEIVEIGAVVRLAPIKDIKTMIYAFAELLTLRDNVRLHIMGGTDDEQYGSECHALVEALQITDKVLFTGRVNVVKYMEKIDFTLLTSISEGQPLSVLESLAAKRPCVTTDVGCCRELLEGKKGDNLGVAGYCVPPMYREGLAKAMHKMCQSDSLRMKMGTIGSKRVSLFYRQEQMMAKYRNLYEEVEEKYGRDRI